VLSSSPPRPSWPPFRGTAGRIDHTSDTPHHRASDSCKSANQHSDKIFVGFSLHSPGSPGRRGIRLATLPPVSYCTHARPEGAVRRSLTAAAERRRAAHAGVGRVHDDPRALLAARTVDARQVTTVVHTTAQYALIADRKRAPRIATRRYRHTDRKAVSHQLPSAPGGRGPQRPSIGCPFCASSTRRADHPSEVRPCGVLWWRRPMRWRSRVRYNADFRTP